MASDFVLAPIPPTDADLLRAAGGVRVVADAHPGYPCRQCLRDAEIGEAMLLVSYDPFEVDSPYRSASAIFLHEIPCRPANPAGDIPEQLTCRRLSVRGFDDAAMLRSAAVVEGTELADTAARLFEDPEIVRLHVHNAGPGCWATAIERGATVGRSR